MKKKIIFIINPISGVSGHKRTAELIQAHIDKDQFDFRINYTQYPKHATELATEAAYSGYDIVVAVGGDGTVNEVAQAIVNTNTSLAIIPRGSGNGLARHLGIPINVEKSIKVINAGSESEIDTLLINNTPCIGIAGIGFDGFVAHLFDTNGKRGLTSYAKIVLRQLKKYKPQRFEITINGITTKRELFLLTFANSSQFGNNARIAPQANISDGLFELCMLKRIPTFRIPHFIYLLFSGKANKSAYLETVSVSAAKIKCTYPYMHIDGEPYAAADILNVDLLPHSLKIWN